MKRIENEIELENIVKENPGITGIQLARMAHLKNTAAVYTSLYYAVNIYEEDGKLYFYEWKKR